MLTYYGITPTTYDYNLLLGIPMQYFGLVSAMTPFVAAISCLIYNRFTEVHYKRSYLISIACLCFGSFLYSLSFTYRGLAVLFIGRCLFGYGGARILTRKFFTREIHADHRIKWSAILVGFTGMSMTFGPGFSALLQTIFDSEESKSIKLDHFSALLPTEQDIIVKKLTAFSIAGMRFSKVNYLPSVTMLIFFVMFFVFLFFYKDTPKKSQVEVKPDRNKKSSSTDLKYMISDIKHIQMLPGDTVSPKVPVADRHKILK